jgi:hypothetical protein
VSSRNSMQEKKEEDCNNQLYQGTHAATYTLASMMAWGSIQSCINFQAIVIAIGCFLPMIRRHLKAKTRCHRFHASILLLVFFSLGSANRGRQRQADFALTLTSGAAERKRGGGESLLILRT